MAKWGEGDPRWIVEERPDSTNVNNWHWTERDAFIWSKERLTYLFNDINIANDQGQWKVKEVTNIAGEASASNRKGKLIFFYEITIKLEWTGHLKDGFTNHKGFIEVTNLSDENDPEDLDIQVSVDELKEEHGKMKDFVRKTGIPVVRETCANYIKDLKQEFSKGMILPTKKVANPPQPINLKPEKAAMTNLLQETEKKTPSPKENKQIMKVQLKIKDEFKTSVGELYHVLTDQQRISSFTRAQAISDAKPGGKFSFLAGNITGQFIELVPEEKISQKWRFSNWPEGLFSTVTMNLSQREDCAVLELEQTGIPDFDFERTEMGWKRYFFEGIKHTFGFGSRLF